MANSATAKPPMPPQDITKPRVTTSGSGDGSGAKGKGLFSGSSYAKCLIAMWVIVLLALCFKQKFFVMGAVSGLLAMALLPTADGDAKLLFPLFLLSERLLVETTSLRHSPVMLFACALFAYCADAAKSNGESMRVSVAYAVIGVGCFFGLTSQATLALPMSAYVFTALVVYSQLLKAATLREAITVAHIAGFFVCDAIVNVNLDPANLKQLTITCFTYIGGRSAMLMGLSVCFFMLGCGKVLPTSLWWGRGKASTALRTIVFLVSTAIFTAVAYWYCGQRFNEDPFVWLIQYVLSSAVRTLALLGWCVGLPIAIAICAKVQAKGTLHQIVYRKLYHLIAIVAFLPVGVFDPEFLAFSIMLATTLGMLAECARVCEIGVPGMAAFDRFMLTSIDARDGGGNGGSNNNTVSALGAAALKRVEEKTSTTSKDDSASSSSPLVPSKPLIRTHLFLMFGLALSIVLHARQQQMPARPLAPLVLVALFLVPGLIGLGVSDAAAAVGGTIAGRGSIFKAGRGKRSTGGAEEEKLMLKRASAPPLYLSRVLCGRVFSEDTNSALTHKTVVGTACGLVSGAAVWMGIVAYLCLGTGLGFHFRALIPSLAGLVFGVLFEAFVDGIDNLEMPLFTAGVIQTAVLVLGKFFA